MTTDLALQVASPGDTLAVRFLHQGGQPASEIADQMADFIDGSRRDLLLAVYDCRLDDATAAPIRTALQRALTRGVNVRLVYDNSFAKPQTDAGFNQNGGDFAEPNTHDRVAELGLPEERIRAISGPGLMHNKYMVRDDDAIWTGSMNWTNDSMARMENTLLTLRSSELAHYFVLDFDQLWQSGSSINSGKFRTNPASVVFNGKSAPADVDFSPGQGEYINDMVARRILRAQHRIVFCSMLINSSKLLSSLMTVLENGQVDLWGVYDRTQMEGVLNQWRGQPQLQWKIDAIESLMRRAEMVGKQSLPYRPGRSHNFMHNKLLVIDDTVVTGSYNLSHSAEANAENMMAIDSPALAERAVEYVRMLRNSFLENPNGSDSQKP
jgi:phosphatidylserine/phosphatidylglycerophosphate/cardiolipin synthase-like enzyme